MAVDFSGETRISCFSKKAITLLMCALILLVTAVMSVQLMYLQILSCVPIVLHRGVEMLLGKT